MESRFGIADQGRRSCGDSPLRVFTRGICLRLAEANTAAVSRRPETGRSSLGAMSVAFIFPGQGSQHPGMLHELLDHPAVLNTLDEISDELHYDVRTLDMERCLEYTVPVQLALFAAGVAIARALMRYGIGPVALAGLSVGAFASAVIAGVLSLKDGVGLVKLRAEQMMNLYPSGYGLSAIEGLNEPQVTKIVQAVYSQEAPVFVGNINAPRQIVIAGANRGMELALDEARRLGARKELPLQISGPPHCTPLPPGAQ